MILVIFGGLPGTGKTTIARRLATAIPAMYMRIDTLEQAIVRTGKLAMKEMEGAGYDVAMAVVSDNLKNGLSAVADSVNPLGITREAWRHTATSAGASYLEVEIVCSDREEHRRRVEGRQGDIAGLILPDWEGVMQREYERWNDAGLVIDTAMLCPNEAVELILEACRRITSE